MRSLDIVRDPFREFFELIYSCFVSTRYISLFTGKSETDSEHIEALVQSSLRSRK